jgi:hypothetical protein
MLWWWDFTVLSSQIGLEDTTKEFQQDLEADLGNGRIVATLAELVPDESMLRPGELVEASNDTSLTELSTNKIAASVGDMSILDAKDHGNLSLELMEKVQSVIAVRRGGRGSVGSIVGT